MIESSDLTIVSYLNEAYSVSLLKLGNLYFSDCKVLYSRKGKASSATLPLLKPDDTLIVARNGGHYSMKASELIVLFPRIESVSIIGTVARATDIIGNITINGQAKDTIGNIDITVEIADPPIVENPEQPAPEEIPPVITDIDAMAYLAAVAAADGEELEWRIQAAVQTLFTTLKRIGSLYDVGIFCGPRTVAGACVPPDVRIGGRFRATNITSGDYNRVTGFTLPSFRHLRSAKINWWNNSNSRGTLAVYAQGEWNTTSGGINGYAGSGTVQADIYQVGPSASPEWRNSLILLANTIEFASETDITITPLPELPVFISCSRRGTTGATRTEFLVGNAASNQFTTSGTNVNFQSSMIGIQPGGITNETTAISYYYQGNPVSSDIEHRDAVLAYHAAVAAAVSL